LNPFPDDAFLALVPVQALASEPGPDGSVVLIRPKILSPRWAWLVRMMKRPAYRVKLDTRGALVWQTCDGTHTVAQVAQVVAERFPQEMETVPRTARFLLELARGGFTRLEVNETPSLQPPGQLTET
jgi:hypothetical protein